LRLTHSCLPTGGKNHVEPQDYAGAGRASGNDRRPPSASADSRLLGMDSRGPLDLTRIGKLVAKRLRFRSLFFVPDGTYPRERASLNAGRRTKRMKGYVDDI